MEKCYINGVGCVSAQQTTEGGFLEHPIDYAKENIIRVIKPEYKAFIPPAAIRRMSNSVKSSVVASQLALKEASREHLNGIITGTGLGCISDSEKFLNKLLDNDEQYLTPTSFIQSTHNTVAGQIALGLACKAYNVTYVNGSASFPSALLDGLLKIQTGENGILVGGVDELSDYTNTLYRLITHYKKEDELHGSILSNRSQGCVPGEGAAFFVLEQDKKTNSYAELLDVDFRNSIIDNKLEDFVKAFLKRNNLSIDDLDLIVQGNNGDVDFDDYYDQLAACTPKVAKVYFKHIFGESMTSSAIGLWVAANILKNKSVPAVLLKEQEVEIPKSPKIILLYNQYRGRDHSLTLVQNV